MRRTAIQLAAVCAFAVVLALGTVGAAHAACSCPVRYDHECLTLGRTGVGSEYWLGHACWSTSNREWGGSDCSGFVAKAWQVPRRSSIYEDYHPYSTTDLFTQRYHWYPVGRSTAYKADAVGYPPPPGKKYGHAVLYYYGSAYGQAFVYEATPPRIVAHWRDLSGSGWYVRRRHNLIQTYGPA